MIDQVKKTVAKKKASSKTVKSPLSYCYGCGNTLVNIDGCPYCHTDKYIVDQRQ